jgi:LPXTG-motif cell wall-anchored protein
VAAVGVSGVLPAGAATKDTTPTTAKVSGGQAPAGNNGTIKIDGVPAEDGNDNKPHPGCAFTVEFFGYDAGARTATLAFEAQAPTDGGMLLEDTQHFTVAERTGGNQLDHRAQYDLSTALATLTPHQKQGYHVKLTVHVDGAQGADEKHKVFWVSECANAGVFAADTAVAPTTTTTVAVPVTTPAPSGVLGAEETAPAGGLPRTGSSTAPLALTAFGLVAAGGALVAAGRRKQTA